MLTVVAGFVESVVVGEDVFDRLWVASDGFLESAVEAVPVPDEGDDTLNGVCPGADAAVTTPLNPSLLFIAATVRNGLGANDELLDLGEIEIAFVGGDSSPSAVTPDDGLPIALPSFGLYERINSSRSARSNAAQSIFHASSPIRGPMDRSSRGAG